MANRVLVLGWNGSAYDSLRGLLRLAAAEWARDGVEVLEAEVGTPGGKARLEEVLNAGGLTCALGMSGIGSDLVVQDGRSVWEAAGVPFFNWNCDHPCYFPERHVLRSRFLLHGYVFADHADYAMRHLDPNGVAYSVHLGLPPRDLFALRPRQSRNGRIMFTKSGGDPNRIEANWRDHPAPLPDILFAAAETLRDSSTRAFLPVLQQVAEPHGLHLAGSNVLALRLMRELDAYVRVRRTNLVAAVARRFPVDVFGAGWDHFDWGAGPARHGGSLDWHGMVERLPAYLGCLSVNPLVERSAHDRVFFALSAGVAPVSDANAFVREKMALLEPCCFGFDADAVAAALDRVLARPDDALERAEATWAALHPEYSLRHSLRRILAFARLAELNAKVGPQV